MLEDSAAIPKLSSPAQAGDPATTTISIWVLHLVPVTTGVTGSPASAGDDNCGRPPYRAAEDADRTAL